MCYDYHICMYYDHARGREPNSLIRLTNWLQAFVNAYKHQQNTMVYGDNHNTSRSLTTKQMAICEHASPAAILLGGATAAFAARAAFLDQHYSP